jgi:hypothetical protein
MVPIITAGVIGAGNFGRHDKKLFLSGFIDPKNDLFSSHVTVMRKAA